MDDSPTPQLAPELQSLTNILEESPESLAAGNEFIQKAALNAAKYIFDLSLQSEISSRPHILELLLSLSPLQAPQTRSQAKAASHQPTPNVAHNAFDLTPLRSLFVDGMNEEQLWVQLDLRTKTICRMLDVILEGEVEDDAEDTRQDGEDSDEEQQLRSTLEEIEEDGDIDMDAFMERYEFEESDASQSPHDQGSDSDESEKNWGMNDGEEGTSHLRDPDEESESDSSPVSQPSRLRHHPRKGKSKCNSELDDDFFNLAQFNADTERAEAKSASKGRLAGDDSDEEDMDIDLFAAVGESEDMDEEDMENGIEELFYRDFFEPPSRLSSRVGTESLASRVRFHDEVRVKKIKPSGKNKPLDYDSDDDDDESFDNEAKGFSIAEDEDFDEEDKMNSESDEELLYNEEPEEAQGEIPTHPDAITRLKYDLFAEEDENPNDDMTTHQKRMSALKEQIAELESENVSQKDWMLMGEAGSRARPQNSLLEEDLEFDRVMKAVPVITEDVVKSLEGTIKARILEGRFDDVIRMRPLEDKPFLPSKFFELQDSKSTQSLAQIYESDYVVAQGGGGIGDDRDGKLKKEHDEISIMWDRICGKLDALCNAHFVPKQPKATISTIAGTATTTLESALPTTKSVTTTLAPEEIFSVDASALRARSELTPIEKRSLRTKARKIKRKQRDRLENAVDKISKAKGIGGIKRQKKAALESVVKLGKGVTVVGKKGNVIIKEKWKHSTRQ